jgi:hypothetical protein
MKRLSRALCTCNIDMVVVAEKCGQQMKVSVLKWLPANEELGVLSYAPIALYAHTYHLLLIIRKISSMLYDR